MINHFILKKNICNLISLVLLFALMPLKITAQSNTVVYNFENDSFGSFPKNITAKVGTASVFSYGGNKAIQVVDYDGGGLGSFYLDAFPEAKNYSVIWKQTITDTDGRDTGVLLKAHGTSNFSTVIDQGYLFISSASNDQHLSIRRYAPNGQIPKAPQLASVGLTPAAIGSSRWFKATVNGSNLIFEYSDNGDVENPTWVKLIDITDTVYENISGKTMLLQGLGTSHSGCFFDNIEFIDLEKADRKVISKASISINVVDYKQTIDMIGGDMERSSKAVQTTCKNTDDVIQWGFGDIHYNFCRVQFDKNQELVEGTKNWAFYEKQVLTMQQIKAINPDIKFWATLKSDYDGYGDKNNMPDWIVKNFNANKPNQAVVDTDKWAIFLADYLEYMQNNNVPIHTLSTVKEWNAYINAEESRDIILKLIDECSARGISMPLINDSASWSMAAGRGFMNGVKNLDTKNLYAGFSNHEYASNDTPEVEWPQNVAIAASLGKKLYQDETITGAGLLDGTIPPVFRYAQRAVLYQSGVSGEIMFEIWSRGLNNEIRSIYWKNGGTAYRLSGHYIAKHFTNNVLNSQYITSTTENTLGGAYSASLYTGITKMAFRKGNKVMLWVMNMSHNTHPQNTADYSDFTINVNDANINGNIEHKYWDVGSVADGTINIEGIASTISPSSSTSFKVNKSIEPSSIHVFSFNVTDSQLSVKKSVSRDSSMFYIEKITQNELKLSDEVASYKIISISGAVLKKGASKTSKINISILSKGVYVLRVLRNNQKTSTLKFVKS